MMINRGKVHIIENEQGKLSSLTDEGKVRISIRQIELHMVEGRGKTVVKEHYMDCPIDLLRYTLRKGHTLPGNIHIIQQLEPYNEDDHMEALLWKDGKVVRTEDNKAIYEIKWYSEQEEWQPTAEIDKLLVI
jgi:hypothetical protein